MFADKSVKHSLKNLKMFMQRKKERKKERKEGRNNRKKLLSFACKESLACKQAIY